MSKEPQNDDQRTLDDDVAALIDGLEEGGEEGHSDPQDELRIAATPAPPPPHVNARRTSDPVIRAEAQGVAREGPLAERSEPTAAATIAKQPQKPAASAASQESIESLDAQLAGLAEDLLDQEPGDTPDPEPYRPAMPAIAALQPEVYRPPPAPAREPTPEAPSQDTAAPADAATAVVAADNDGPSALRQALSSGSGVVLEHVHRGLTAISGPLASRPPVVRTTVGIAAAFNLLLAGVVWSYVAFLQPEFAAPPPPLAKAAAKSEKGDDGKKGADKKGADKKGAEKKDAKGKGH